MKMSLLPAIIFGLLLTASCRDDAKKDHESSKPANSTGDAEADILSQDELAEAALGMALLDDGGGDADTNTKSTFDTNGDGVIDESEKKEAKTKILAACNTDQDPILSTNERRACIKKFFDTDGDNKLSPDERKAMVEFRKAIAKHDDELKKQILRDARPKHRDQIGENDLDSSKDNIKAEEKRKLKSEDKAQDDHKAKDRSDNDKKVAEGASTDKTDKTDKKKDKKEQDKKKLDKFVEKICGKVDQGSEDQKCEKKKFTCQTKVKKSEKNFPAADFETCKNDEAKSLYISELCKNHKDDLNKAVVDHIECKTSI